MPVWKQISGGGKLQVLSEAWLLMPVLTELERRSALCASDRQYIGNN